MLGSVRGVFEGSEVRWATVDKEAFDVVSMFKCSDYLFDVESIVFVNALNLSYIFQLEATGIPPPTAATQWLRGWGAKLAQFRSCIVHMRGLEQLG